MTGSSTFRIGVSSRTPVSTRESAFLLALAAFVAADFVLSEIVELPGIQ